MSSALVPSPRPAEGLGWRRLDRRLTRPFPTVPGNSIELLEIGQSFYGRMLDAIDGAQRSVEVEMYLWDDDEVGRSFVRALAEAARRGVRVRVLIDAYGAREVRGALRAVAEAGGDVREFNPLRLRFLRRFIRRTHKKIVIADERTGFTGGAGFSLFFSSGKRSEVPWFDRMFEVTGPVCAHLGQVFDADFSRWAPDPRFGRRRSFEPATELPEAVGDARLRVLRGWPDASDFPAALLDAVDTARDRIWIGTPYFVPPRPLRRALLRARRRGVDVQVVVPARAYAHPLLYHACRRRYRTWLRAGVGIHEFQPGFYHAKLVVTDRRLALFGSSNLDPLSWRRNAEVDLAAHDEDTVERLARALEEDRARSVRVTRDDLLVRGVLDRMWERIAGSIEEWL